MLTNDEGLMNVRAIQRQEGGSPLEKLYFNRCPYEHIVIPQPELHPKLQAHIEMIKELRDLARGRTLWDLLMAGELSSHMIFLPATIPLINYGRIELCKKKIDPILRRYPQEDRDAINKAFQLALVPGAKYLPVNTATKLTTGVIQRIINNEESPFQNVDPGIALQDYHYGVIDNNFSLVLMKHPEAKNSVELRGVSYFIKKMQWHQPFQRSRFALAKPEMRENSPIMNTASALPQGAS